MRNHIFVRLNYKNYLDRIKPMLAGPLIFACFVIAIGYLGTDSAWTIVAGLALFAIYFVEHLKWGRIYITEIREMPENKLRITYLDKNEVKEYTADKKTLVIERNSVRFRLRADKEQYLLFKDEQKGFSLKQYVLGDWVDELIDEVMDDWQPQGAIVSAV